MTIELEIKDLSRGGSGVARHDSGRVIFVPFTAPGDRVLARVVREEKNFAHAELVELLDPSPQRVRPKCAVFGRCGGCQWQHLPYELQWKTKIAGAQQALKRVGVQLQTLGLPIEEFSAERVWEYRNRIQLRGEGDELGFFASGTQTRVNASRCEIARPELNAAWQETREQGAERVHPFKVEVEVLPDGSVRKSWNARHGALGFRQVHDDQNDKLKSWIHSEVTPGARILDLYGGSGNLSLGLGFRAAVVECVDVGSPVGADAQSIVRNGWGGALGAFQFFRAPVEKWVVKRAGAKNAPCFDLAILDPPREGLAKNLTSIADALEAMSVRRLIAVGCDPDAWAKDVSNWLKNGWQLEKVAFFDFFPQTPHVESIAVLSKGL